MSYNNSDKEFYYALYLKFNKEKLERVLNLKLEDLELEKNFAGRKIDVFTILEDGRKLFLELQLNPSDNIHLEQIKNIIKYKELNNIVVVWIALEFKSDMLSKIEQEIKSSNRNIRFIALRLNEKLLPHLHILNNMFINKVVENLKILNEVDNHFKIEEIFFRLQDEINVVNVKKQVEILDLNKKEDVMKCILQQLRNEIYYYPSIHRNKQINNNVIVLAGGKADINYNIGLDRRNFIYVQIRFGTKQKAVFDSLLEKEEEISDKLDYLAEFDVENMKIGTYIYFRSNKRKIVIKQIARVTDRYIKTFSPYLYPSNNREEN